MPDATEASDTGRKLRQPRQKLIILSFRPLHRESPVIVRGAHFRICSDGTLRGSDNTVAARYIDGLWHLGQRRHLSFECAGPIHLRVTNHHGRSERIGPYESVRAADGAIFTHDSCLGVHIVQAKSGATMAEMWQEISFLASSQNSHA
jgi:hypothetical protein